MSINVNCQAEFGYSNYLVKGDYWSLIAGSDQADPGKQICACFNVSEQRIIQAIEEGASSAVELGRQLQCGTNCGSCIPELNNLLSQIEPAID